MKRSLMLTASLLFGLGAGLISLHSQADNSDSAPKCKFNQAPVLKDNGTWECQVPQVKTGEKPQKATLLVPAVQKIQAHDTARPIINNNRGASHRDAASGMSTGKRQHKPVTTTKPSEKGTEKPSCAKGESSRVENGHWVCQKPGHAPTPGKGEE